MFTTTHASPVVSRLPTPNPNASIDSLTSLFPKDNKACVVDTKYSINLTETHTGVLVPLCNLNDNLGLLLKVRGKLMAHSGKVRWAPSRFTLVNFHLCWSSFSGGKADPTDESVLHAALREAKKGVGIRRL